MTTFNVHFTRADGTADSKRIDADTPIAAATRIRTQFPDSIIDKVKRWKAPAEDRAQPIGGAA